MDYLYNLLYMCVCKCQPPLEVLDTCSCVQDLRGRFCFIHCILSARLDMFTFNLLLYCVILNEFWLRVCMLYNEVISLEPLDVCISLIANVYSYMINVYYKSCQNSKQPSKTLQPEVDVQLNGCIAYFHLTLL